MLKDLKMFNMRECFSKILGQFKMRWDNFILKLILKSLVLFNESGGMI